MARQQESLGVQVQLRRDAPGIANAHGLFVGGAGGPAVDVPRAEGFVDRHGAIVQVIVHHRGDGAVVCFPQYRCVHDQFSRRGLPRMP
jgi:hypothetical protein